MSIQRDGNWNPGGGNWLEVLPCTALASQTPATSSPSSYPLLPGKAWSRIYCTQETMSFTDDKLIDDNGTLHRFTIEGFSPGDTKAKADQLEALTEQGRVLVRYRDNAQLTRLVGLPDQGLEFTYKLTTDRPVDGYRGYTLTIQGTTTQPCQYE